MEGKEEVKIEDNGIRLTDFKSNEFFINFEGQVLEEKPVKVEKTKPKNDGKEKNN